MFISWPNRLQQEDDDCFEYFSQEVADGGGKRLVRILANYFVLGHCTSRSTYLTPVVLLIRLAPHDLVLKSRSWKRVLESWTSIRVLTDVQPPS